MKKLKVAVPTHAGTSEKILDDENGYSSVGRNNQGPFDPRFGVDEMVASLAGKSEAVSLEDGNKDLVVDWPK